MKELNKELRIGNWGRAKKCDGTLRDMKVTHIGKICAKSGDWAITEPIPLTEEWLVKFGFKKDKIDSTFYKNDF